MTDRESIPTFKCMPTPVSSVPVCDTELVGGGAAEVWPCKLDVGC